MEDLEITQQDGREPSSSEPRSGSPSPQPASWARALVEFANQAIATFAILWHGRALIELAEKDARPLLGAGIVLLTAALGARPRDLIGAIKAWRSK